MTKIKHAVNFAPSYKSLISFNVLKFLQYFILALALGLVLPLAHALKLINLSPQGQVAKVQQVAAQFDEDAVKFGDPLAPAPLTVECDNKEAAAGGGRWLSGRQWVFDFYEALPDGVSCRVMPVSNFKSPSSSRLEAKARYEFNTGGPRIVNTSLTPNDEAIDTRQIFLLELSSQSAPQSVLSHVWCGIARSKERIAVELIEGQVREAVIGSMGRSKAAQQDPKRFFALRCTRPLPASTGVHLVYGKGVATPSGLVNKEEQRLEFEVRPPFAIKFDCVRAGTIPQSPCLPNEEMVVDFNAPIKYALAREFTLKGAQNVIAPSFSDIRALKDASQVTQVRFSPPFAENAEYALSVPADLVDYAGRSLAKMTSASLTLHTGMAPPTLAFATSTLSILERATQADGEALVPLTVSRVEPQLSVLDLAIGHALGSAQSEDAQIIAWMQKIERYDKQSVPWSAAARDLSYPLQMHPRKHGNTEDADARQYAYIESRALSLLEGKKNVHKAKLPAQRPQSGGANPFTTIGIPVSPGYHVLEAASNAMGKALLPAEYGNPRPMYARTGVLVTNLAVHFKLGRENALAWVTSLDSGLPVSGARVNVSDCHGKRLASSLTNEQGIAAFDALQPIAPLCKWDKDGLSDWVTPLGYFVSARAKDAKGNEDLAFVWSSSQEGIENWRSKYRVAFDQEPDLIAHTVFDRTLFKAGETVQMRHYLRAQTGSREGLAAPESRLWPDTLVITHVAGGDGQQHEQSLAWRKTASGGLVAESAFAIPKDAKLGEYSVTLKNSQIEVGAERILPTGSFHVDQFRLPVFTGSIGPKTQGALIAAESVPAEVQMQYLAGGSAAGLAVQISAMVRAIDLEFPQYSDYSFRPPRPDDEPLSSDERGGDVIPEFGMQYGATQGRESSDWLKAANPIAVKLGSHGAASAVIGPIPPSDKPRELLLEAAYHDPNGEMQTLSKKVRLWNSGVVAGVKSDGWIVAGDPFKVQALALDTEGKPQSGVPLEVRAIERSAFFDRFLQPGGYYSYDSQKGRRDLGVLCSGKSDAQGLLTCTTQLKGAGNYELVTVARDAQGRESRASALVYASDGAAAWFASEKTNPIEVLADKQNYSVGEIAHFQVRMPFSDANALICVEREGIMKTQVIALKGDKPSFDLKIEPGWGPNVYVSVLALSARVHPPPAGSSLTPPALAQERPAANENKNNPFVPPQAQDDSAKPMAVFGVAGINVDLKEHTLNVKLTTDKTAYGVRENVRVTISATLPDGKSAAGAQLTLVAVDQALLDLQDNNSWQLLEAMFQRRSWRVQTSTAQMKILGLGYLELMQGNNQWFDPDRFKGKNTRLMRLTAEGGGMLRMASPPPPPSSAGPLAEASLGIRPTRELFDALLLWNQRIKLDDKGTAEVSVPLNDSLTTFRIVAIADEGVSLFGTGEARITTTQDLQIASGLPPIVREGDRLRAQITVRNASREAMKVRASASAPPLAFKDQTVDIPAGGSKELFWDMVAPVLSTTGAAPGARAADAGSLSPAAASLAWTFQARANQGNASDALHWTQRVLPAVPLAVLQGNLVQLDATEPYATEVAPAPGALPNQGGVHLALQPRLATGLPAIEAWFRAYPFDCLEQLVSIAIGSNDTAAWRETTSRMPNYLDRDGLAYYFPGPSLYEDHGSVSLTAYILSASHEAQRLNKAYQLPPEVQQRMLGGLSRFVLGHIRRKTWSPRPDLDERKLAAIEALSRYGKANAQMLKSISLTPNSWPTSALIDYKLILTRIEDAPERGPKVDQVNNILRSRLSYQGTRLVFSTEKDDFLWWLMTSGDVNSARLLLATIDDPAWNAERAKMIGGMINRQQNGAWRTTTANLWGSLALREFSQKYERDAVTGSTTAELGGLSQSVNWSDVRGINATDPQGLAHQGSFSGAPSSPVALMNNAMMLPWPQPGKSDKLQISHKGSGKPWATMQAIAAAPLKKPLFAGYQIERKVTAIQAAKPGEYTRGDLLRISLTIKASADMTWVVVSDPIPAGATIQGNGLGRDSQIATAGEKNTGIGFAGFEERTQQDYRRYYEYLPKGAVTLEYTVRLNNDGVFNLPPTHVEAMYAPEMFASYPNAPMTVAPQP